MTSRSTSGPEPAACERTSERCSCSQLDRDVAGRQGPETGGDPVVRLRVVGEGPMTARLRRTSARRAPTGRPARRGATATTSSKETGPVPTVTWLVAVLVLAATIAAPPSLPQQW